MPPKTLQLQRNMQKISLIVFEIKMNERKNIVAPLILSYSISILRLNMGIKNKGRAEKAVFLHAVRDLETWVFPLLIKNMFFLIYGYKQIKY